MSDPIVSFPLRGAPCDGLGESLGRCFAEFLAWSGNATVISGFAQDSRDAGVSEGLAWRVKSGLDTAVELGILELPKENSELRQVIVSNAVEHQLKVADSGAKLAAIVILHNACERYLYRLVRFGLVANRDKAVEWIAKRKVTIQAVVDTTKEILVDQYIEEWWDELERESLLAKWDKLVALVGYPSNFTVGTCHFDRDMLVELDDVRINAVHHDGQALMDYDLDGFASQLSRALMCWFCQVARCLNLRVPATAFFGIATSPGSFMGWANSQMPSLGAE